MSRGIVVVLGFSMWFALSGCGEEQDAQAPLKLIEREVTWVKENLLRPLMMRFWTVRSLSVRPRL